jgi:hypothetical protein
VVDIEPWRRDMGEVALMSREMDGYQMSYREGEAEETPSWVDMCRFGPAFTLFRLGDNHNHSDNNGNDDEDED